MATKKTIQAIPVEIFEKDGKFYYRLEKKEGQFTESRKGFYYESQAWNAAEKAIEYHWYVGH